MEAPGKINKSGLFDDDFMSRWGSKQKLSKMEASRLEIQWKKICDQEKRSKERNRELLKEFERVEQHAYMLAVKTDRLKSYKQQYENYINKMYPRWKEDLEKYRLSKQQNMDEASRNVSRAMLSPSKSDVFGSRSTGYSHFSSKSAHRGSSVPFDSAVLYDRSPESTTANVKHISPAWESHSNTSFGHGRYDFPRTSDGIVPQQQYSQQTDRRWQMPSFHNSGGQLDSSQRLYNPQLASTSQYPVGSHQLSPDLYPGQLFGAHLPPSEAPSYLPSDLRLMRPEFPGGRPQSANPAAPYEARTELQRSYLGRGGLAGNYDQQGLVGNNYDGQPSGYHGNQIPSVDRQVSDNRGILSQDTKFTKSSPETRLSMRDEHNPSQNANDLTSVNQPSVPSEKPLEGRVPSTTSLEPSPSSTLMESTEGGKDFHRIETIEDRSTTLSAASHPRKTIQDREPEKTGTDDASIRPSPQVLAGGSGMSDRSREGVKEAEQLEMSSAESFKLSKDVSPESLGVTKEEKKHSLLELQDSNEVNGGAVSDQEESLVLSDVSLPDSNAEQYVPSVLQRANRRDSGDSAKTIDLAAEEEPNLKEVSKPAIDPDIGVSVTEDISEDIPESVASETNVEDDMLLLQETVSQPGKLVSVSDENNMAINEGVEKEEKMVSSKVLQRNEVAEEEHNLSPKQDTEELELKKTDDRKTHLVSTDGFLAMLKAVDADVEVSFSPEALYRSPQCSSDLRHEIVSAAEVGSGLQAFDPNTVSMIILEEMPLLVSSSPAGCLIPDRVFAKDLICKREEELRDHVESSLIKLWKALFNHLVNVVTNNVMNAQEVGNMFGHLLISKNSRFVTESQELLGRVLEAAVSAHSDSPLAYDDLDLEPRLETEVPHNDDVSVASAASSSTLGSTPPKVQSVVRSEEKQRYENDFEEDVPLTETAAYLKMIGSAQTPEAEDEISDILEGSEQQKQDESEADDDVERELARSISPPVTSPRARSPNQSKSGKAKPKLALFDTRGAAPDENTNKSLGDSWGGSSEKSIKSEIADSESLESPPLSPDGFGYVPTAVENKDRPSAGHKDEKDQEKSEPKSANDSKVKRKTDFWNNSDTESEIDLQLSTGGFDQEGDDDDFDFYG